MKVHTYMDPFLLGKKSGITSAMGRLQRAHSLSGIEQAPVEEADVVHVNGVSIGGMVLAKQLKGKKPLVVTAHTTAEDFAESFLLSSKIKPITRIFLKEYYSLFDVIVVPSLYSKRLLESYDIGKPIVPVSNGIETEKYRRVERLRKEFRESEGIYERFFVSVGVVLKRKGVEDFYLTAKLLPQYRFYWFGAILRNLIEGEQIRQIIKSPPSNMRFYGIIEDVRVAYSAADIFLFPSKEENQGLAVLEAMAAGLPVIIRDHPVFEEFRDGETCMKAKDSLEFVLKSKQLAEDEELASRIGKAAQAYVERHHLSRVGQRLKNLYEALLEGRLNEILNSPHLDDPTAPTF